MIAGKRLILQDKTGFYYMRSHGNRITKERMEQNYCRTCGKIIYIHSYKRNKEKYCSHKCQPVWNKGRIYSTEEKQKLDITGLQKGRAWNKGKKGISEETRKKTSLAHTGKINEKSSHWKGGLTLIDKRERGRIEIKLWRESVFKRDNYTCQNCGAQKIFLNAHHIKSFKHFPELRTAIENGITLCRECHREEHRKKSLKRKA